MKGATKTQRILFLVGTLLGCGVFTHFFKNSNSTLTDFLQGAGVGLMLAVMFKVCRNKSRREA